MGAWGYDLLENDTSLEAVSLYEKYLKEGNGSEQAVELTLKRWGDLIDILSIKTDVYIGIIHTQIKYKSLLEETRLTMIDLINKKATLTGWFSHSDAINREKVLEDFKQKLLLLKGIDSSLSPKI